MFWHLPLDQLMSSNVLVFTLHFLWSALTQSVSISSIVQADNLCVPFLESKEEDFRLMSYKHKNLIGA